MGGAPQHRLFHSVVLGVRVPADQAKSANTQQQEYITRLSVLFESDPAADETRDADIKGNKPVYYLVLVTSGPTSGRIFLLARRLRGVYDDAIPLAQL